MGTIGKRLFSKFLIKMGYVDTTDLQEYLLRIKENERKRTTEELERKFIDDKNRLKEEHFLEIEEKNAEIRHLGIIIDDMKQYVKDVEKVYVTSIKGVKTNLRISTEIGYQVKKLMETSTTVYAAFENIQQQAEEHKRDLITNEKINRTLLRID